MDYEGLTDPGSQSKIKNQKSKMLGRFVGFVKEAWDNRKEIGPDESNGVSPLDSKFGFAWRDYRILAEWARRSGDTSFRKTADHIREIVESDDSKKKIIGGQDDVHRLYALSVFKGKATAPTKQSSISHLPSTRLYSEIKSAIDYLFSKQSPDGSWPVGMEKAAFHKHQAPDAEGLEYLTGQIVDTLVYAGVPRTDPRLVKAGRWLLSRQKEFGGWFQTGTCENFVTPMRESRYAVMALSDLFPVPPVASVPTSKMQAGVLGQLDDLWRVPAAERTRTIKSVSALLHDSNPFVR